MLKKSDLVQKVLDLKGKVFVDVDLQHKLCEKIEKLTYSMDQIVVENTGFSLLRGAWEESPHQPKFCSFPPT